MAVEALDVKVFQSSPVPRDGCNLVNVFLEQLESVSILTRPEGRVQLTVVHRNEVALFVSILTRPEGRVQRYTQ